MTSLPPLPAPSLRADAEDALQSAWLRIVRSFGGLREPGLLGPWMYGVARRTAQDRLRRSFGALALLNAGWCAALARILVRRAAVIDDRLLLARTAVFAASLFGIAETGVAILRDQPSSAAAVAALSLTFLWFASALLARTSAARGDLLELKAALMPTD